MLTLSSAGSEITSAENNATKHSASDDTVKIIISVIFVSNILKILERTSSKMKDKMVETVPASEMIEERFFISEKL
jgi:hypothetical protein